MSGWLFGRGGGGGGAAGGALAAAALPTSTTEAPTTFSTPSSQTSAAVPLQLVRVSADGTGFELGEDALRVLRSIRGPVAVAAVAGRARQGKSSLLNGLLRTANAGNANAGGKTSSSSGGFEVGPTTRPTTKGLWIWGSPIEVNSADGGKHHLILLDTEGIDAVDQTGSYSAQIFSLALLLSSLLVLNSIGPIDEAALDRLSLVAALTRRIRVRADEGGRGGAKKAATGGNASADAELSEFTPAFLWLLRDFYLQLADDKGGSISADDYLEQCLAPTPEGNGNKSSSSASTTSDGAASKNEVRAAIKRLFPRRGAAALVRPVSDERDLQRLDSLPESALRPEFRQGMKDLTSRVLSLAAPKRLGRSLVTGPALAALAQAYVSAINGGAVPSIASAWAGVAEAECRAAADSAESAYRETFSAQISSNSSSSSSSSLPPTTAAVDRAHAAALVAGERAYNDRALGEDERVRSAGDRAWRERAERSYSDSRARAEAEAEALAARAAAAAGAEVAAFVSRPLATLEGLAGAVSAAEAAFANSMGGPELCRSSPAAAAAWANFLSGPAAAAARTLAARDAAAASARASAEVLSSQRRVRELEDELSRARGQAQGAATALARAEAAVGASGAREGELSAEVSRLRSELTAAEARARAAEQEARELSGRLEASGRRVSELEAAVADAHAKVAAASAAAAFRPPPPVIPSPPPPAAFAAAPPPSSTPSSLPPLDGSGPSNMTVAALKQWLTDAGRGEEAWRLSNERAKKGAFVAAVEAVLRGE